MWLRIHSFGVVATSYDVLQMWVNAKGNEALIKEYKEVIKKLRMNWDEKHNHRP